MPFSRQLGDWLPVKGSLYQRPPSCPRSVRSRGSRRGMERFFTARKMCDRMANIPASLSFAVYRSTHYLLPAGRARLALR